MAVEAEWSTARVRPPLEGWERARDAISSRVVRAMTDRPGLLSWAMRLRACGLWVGLVWLLAMAAVSSTYRGSLATYVGDGQDGNLLEGGASVTEPADPQLTADDLAVLARMQQHVADAKAAGRWEIEEPDDETSDKFDGPIGVDGEGNIITYNSIEAARAARGEPPVDNTRA